MYAGDTNDTVAFKIGSCVDNLLLNASIPFHDKKNPIVNLKIRKKIAGSNFPRGRKRQVHKYSDQIVMRGVLL